MNRNRILPTVVAGVAIFAWTSLRPELQAAEVPSPADLAGQLNQAFIDVADRASASVVVIRVTHKPEYLDAIETDEGESGTGNTHPRESLKPSEQNRDKSRADGDTQPKPRRRQTDYDSQGSGVVIREDGFILTNRHVVDGAERIRVCFADGREFDATVRGVDSRSDLAVLKVSASHLKVARLGDSSVTRAGEFAIAIGAPFDLDYSVTVGHVSAKGRSQVIDDPTADQDFLQTDANINPGNSGGPLVNLKGEVIGINTLIRGLHTGIGFAIPINLAREVAEKLIAEGRFVRAWLGVGVRALRESPEFRDLNPSLSDGLVVTEIRQDGPARQSELRPGDVILALDGKPVTTPQQLKAEIRTKRVGQTILLNAHRNGTNLPVKITTEAWEDDAPPTSIKAVASLEENTKPFGLGVQALTETLAKQFGVEKTAGVLVMEVEHDSVAREEGLRVGHVITEVNRQPVTTPKQFRDATLAADAKKGAVVVFVTRDAVRCAVLKDSGRSD